jgi:hypothetical protein
VALVLALAAALPAVSAPGPKAKTVEVLGFSTRGSATKLAEPGSTLETRNCKPRSLYAFVAMRRVRAGALVTITWRHAGRVVTRYAEPWAHGTKRRVVRYALPNSLGLPKGSYQLAVKVAGKGTTIAKINLSC